MDNIDYRIEYRRKAVQVQLCWILIAALSLSFIGLAYLCFQQQHEIGALKWDKAYWVDTANALYARECD